MTQPLLSTFPQATGNVLSVGNASVVGANTANVVFQQSTGTLFPGSLVVGPLSNLQTNVAVIQAVTNVATSTGSYASTVVVAFSNTANNNVITGTFGSGGTFVANIYAPTTTAQVPVASSIASGATSAALTFNTFASPLSGVGVSLGQYVAGLPVTEIGRAHV